MRHLLLHGPRGASSPRRALTGALTLTLCLLALLLPTAALAQVQKRVAVLRFEGAPRLQAAVAERVAKEHHLVSLAEWEAAARQLDAQGRSSDQLALVALEVRADAVVTGVVRKDERGVWMITVSARNGKTGKAAARDRFPLRSPTTSQDVLTFIGPALDEALKQDPPTPPEDLVADSLLADPQLADPKPEPRPVWYPYVDAAVGLVFGGRRLDFDEEVGRSPVGCYDFRQPVLDPNGPGPDGVTPVVHQFSNQLQRCPRFPSAVTGGLRLDLTVYPLAARPSRFVRGLGVGISADLPFWPPTSTCVRSSPDAACEGRTSLTTTEYRVEAGLRYALNLLDKRSRVSLLFSLSYGIHAFSLQKTDKTYEFFDPMSNQRVQVQGLDDRGLPDTRYQYLSLGAGARIPYYANKRWSIGMVLDLHYHALLSFGEISARFNDTSSTTALYQGGGYGPTTGHGVRAQVTPIEVMPIRGLTFRLSGYYEAFLLRFSAGGSFLDGATPTEPQNVTPAESARHLARGATDQYFGGILTAGYQY